MKYLYNPTYEGIAYEDEGFLKISISSCLG